MVNRHTRTTTLRRSCSVLALIAFTLLAACGDDGTGPAGGPLAQLAFVVQPADATAGAAIAPAIVVLLQDAAGNVVPTTDEPVTVSIATNPAEGTLSGTTSVDAEGGVAVFDDLWIDKAGSGYVLRATVGTVIVASTEFDIQPAAATQLAFVAQPLTAAKRTVIAPGFEVEVQDAYGNRVTTAAHPITVQLEANPGRMVFHASGGSDGERVLQYVDHLAPEVLPPLANAQSAELNGMVYDSVGGDVLGVSQLTDLVRLDRITGAETTVGRLDVLDLKALTFEAGPGGRLLTGGPFGSELYALDPADATTTLLGEVTIAGDSVTGFNGLATHPASGTIYGVVQLRGNADRRTRNLVTIDVATLVVTNIATMSENGVSGIAFLPDGELLAVTGDGADNPESLWYVDPASAAMTLIVAMGDGDYGEAIAVVPARLGGTLSVTAANGVASFADLQVDAPADGYTLAASAAGLTGATSAAFDITP